MKSSNNRTEGQRELRYSSLLPDDNIFYQIAIIFYTVSILLRAVLLTKEPPSTATILENPIIVLTQVMLQAIKLRNTDKSPMPLKPDSPVMCLCMILSL